MSGDVQPRKRKDKKRKKDELGVEEPRGTAVLGEGDILMHSHHDHGTGGHWCAKIIFFSLLAVLVTLIGLIILENRGLSELEANSVKSQYSGVFEGWLEDAPDDDHHDEHTLELKHHDDDEDDHGFHDDDELSHEDHEDHNDEHDQHQYDEHDDEDSELETEDAEEEGGGVSSFFGKYFGSQKDDEGIEENDDDDQNNSLEENEDDKEEEEDDEEEMDENLSYEAENEETDELDQENDDEEDNATNEENEEDDDEQNDTNEENDERDRTEEENEESAEKFDEEETEDETRENEDDDDHANEDEDEEEEEDTEIEVERIEREVSNEEPISLELGVLKEDDDDHDENDDEEEKGVDDDENTKEDELDEDEEFLETDDEPPPVVERITAPAGKPLPEVDDDDVSSEKPPDTLEEEEEYEKHQEELKREEEQASHIWLKLAVGGALLVATQAVLRRATAPRDEPESDEHETREETPVIDRRMTLIPEQASTHVPESSKEEVKRQIPSITKSAPTPQQRSLEDDDQEEIEEVEVEEEKEEVEKDKELYSDEEVEEEEDEEEMDPPKEVEKETPTQGAPIAATKQAAPVNVKAPTPTKTPTPPLSKMPVQKAEEKKAEPDEEEDEEVPDDVEIIEDDVEEDEEDEEDISDVDDTELLNRLEAKYGRLPEPERPAGYKIPKDGGNSLENDDWPGEPIETYWRRQLNALEEDLRQGAWRRVVEKAGAPELSGSARARYLLAAALDRGADELRDNRMLSRAISAYLNLLKMNEQLSDKKLVQVANRTIDRIQFRGNYLNAEPVYRLLIRRFPNDVSYRNNLSISFLMANRGDLAELVLKETLERWPNDPVALAHYAFVLKTQHNKLEEAVKLFEKALDGDKGPACEPRFYYHFGDALLLLGRFKEAHEVHKRGAKHGHFLSPAQRSLYNVPRLKSQPWWNVDETPYVKLARALEQSWREILKEGQAAEALYEKEKEGLKERGEWSQLDLFVRGMEIPGRCARAPVTCGIVQSEAGAAGCRRGQVKFSAMQPGTHVRPHVGPTNCRLRMHLGLSNTKDTFIRVDQETRQWQEGKVLMFDDSFEHEVWHNGTGTRLVLIVDVWHPDLAAHERRSLTAI